MEDAYRRGRGARRCAGGHGCERREQDEGLGAPGLSGYARVQR